MDGGDKRARRVELLTIALVTLLALLLALCVALAFPGIFGTPLPDWRAR